MLARLLMALRVQRCQFPRCKALATRYDALLDARTCVRHQGWPSTATLTVTVEGQPAMVEAARIVIEEALAAARETA